MIKVFLCLMTKNTTERHNNQGSPPNKPITPHLLLFVSKSLILYYVYFNMGLWQVIVLWALVTSIIIFFFSKKTSLFIDSLFHYFNEKSCIFEFSHLFSFQQWTITFSFLKNENGLFPGRSTHPVNNWAGSGVS